MKIMLKITVEGNLRYTESTEGYKLLQNETGIVYGSVCVDVVSKNYTYTETDELDEVSTEDEYVDQQSDE